MIILLTVVGLLVVLLALIWVQFWLTQRAQRAHFVSTLAIMGQLKSLISCTQKHRGLNATFIQGDQSVRNGILSLRDNINQIITDIQENETLVKEARWDAYLDHWSRLQNSAMTMTAPASFKQHTSLIETMLYLLQDIAEHVEFADKKQTVSDRYFLWREFPQLIEYIGQSRAIGVATATKGESTQIDKVKLGYLCEKINSMSDSVFTSLSGLVDGSSYEQIELAKHGCTNLTATIRRDLINVVKVTLSNKTYFELASQTMDNCNSLLDAEFEKIRQLNSK